VGRRGTRRPATRRVPFREGLSTTLWAVQLDMEQIMKRLPTSNGLLFVVFGLFLVTMGCSSASYSKGESKIHIVNVAQEVEPRQILAGRGDEVRWRNTGTQRIVVSFPASAANRISCRIGFKMEEQTALSAFIDPNSSVSLCFAQLGKYNYQVRLNQNLASSLSDQRASVWIVGRGERNPDPYEEYINFTP
jgi:plastocyanin